MRSIGYLLASIFIITSVQRFWVHPSGAHTHRQSDTIGMSIAFAEQVRERGLSALDFLIYPRILQRGLLDGINASEFPLLNVVSGAGFLLSERPWVGVFLTSLFILVLNLLTAYFYMPILLRAWKIEASGALCLILWFTGNTLASQSNIIMPEGIAFPLVIAGVVHLLKSNRITWHFLIGVILCTLGVATKPTVVITLGALIALPLVNQEYLKQWKMIAMGFILSLIFPAWWYLFHAKHVLSFAEGPQIFALAGFHPFEKLSEVGLVGIVTLILRESYLGQLPIFVGWFFVIAGFALRQWLITALYLLSLVAAISLDGGHIYVHGYYFVGTSVFSMILMAKVLSDLESRRYLRILPMIFLVFGVLFNIRVNVWNWSRDSQFWKINYWDMGTEASLLIDRRYHVITDDIAYPRKLLFLGRSGDMGGEKVYQVCDYPRYLGLPIAILSDKAPPTHTVLCHEKAVQTKIVETPYAKWFVTLIR